MRRSGLCVGCGACGAVAPDSYGQLAPLSEADVAAICPFSPQAPDEDELSARRFPQAPRRDASIGRFEAAYVGHVAEDDFRSRGSSGGLASWFAAELLRLGLVDGVAHVAPRPTPPLFGYRISRTVEQVKAGAKSRYHPVALGPALQEIRQTPGRYALVGVPCFIKALHLLRRRDPLLRARVAFTLGLFCGHMKSAHFGESLAWQIGVPPADLTAIDYRAKDARRPANWYRVRAEDVEGRTREGDWMHLAGGDWGAGSFQNPACDFCDDVVAETADVSFGDAWVEPYASDGRGTNVVVIRAPGLHALVQAALAQGRLRLDEVDADFVARTQAAGLRQRREGLAYRLALYGRRGPVSPRKRVCPSTRLPLRRKLIYRARRRIARDSARVYGLARKLGALRIYLLWARGSYALYEALVYERGWLGAVVARLASIRRPRE
ncbi:Coenzyme F420-reducing hydrogenase, beta subunit [Rhodoblastus acidophilus]|uniref:Coenzyme F420-reducing hydrogenase, beta subunit n=1 Tax=Rhodoblastus acidophilus TaxID=1074 RepID=A0A212RQ80_RHOAC|nr:Coenzyme F420 hydrogenase/dehydrogenase, beta subunit C-terminal domain [Rhodoblastus acidophilus]PPQ38523.1 coenzyme F420 hydrogenase [Rhodoblastus acidophilus]RAI21836.1 coenzyme F420 hydrogenase [Rhodoblastus acidophilus]SNB74691.1 Coenzyme F420-reducing hydrogenase, beta subunit [Rhodoblastus acidophilus]